MFANASPAAAQPLPVAAEPEAPVGVHVVTLRGATPGATWTIYGTEGDIETATPLARCGERGCKLQMPDGNYRLWVDGPVGSGIEDGFAVLSVGSDLDVTATAPSRGKKGGGLALAIVGMAAIPIGALVALVGLSATYYCEDTYSSTDCESARRVTTVGGLMILGGAVLTPVGWVTFARNRGPRVVPTREAPAAAGAHRLEVGLQSFGTGFGLGARALF